MKSKRPIAFFRFFYDFLEICIRNILHLAFIEHRHQCHNNPFRRNPLDIIGQDASPTALTFPLRSNCHPDFIDALPKRSALERVFLQRFQKGIIIFNERLIFFGQRLCPPFKFRKVLYTGIHTHRYLNKSQASGNSSPERSASESSLNA